MEHTSHIVRTASAAANRSLHETDRAAQCIAMVMAAVRNHPAGVTRREIEAETGLRPNQVSGRVKELIDQKRLKERGVRRCNITGNVVNVVVAVEDAE